MFKHLKYGINGLSTYLDRKPFYSAVFFCFFFDFSVKFQISIGQGWGPARHRRLGSARRGPSPGQLKFEIWKKKIGSSKTVRNDAKTVRNDPKMLRKCCENVAKMSWNCCENVAEMLRKCRENVAFTFHFIIRNIIRNKRYGSMDPWICCWSCW